MPKAQSICLCIRMQFILAATARPRIALPVPWLPGGETSDHRPARTDLSRWPRDRLHLQPDRARHLDDHPRHGDPPFRPGRDDDDRLDDGAERVLARRDALRPGAAVRNSGRRHRLHAGRADDLSTARRAPGRPAQHRDRHARGLDRVAEPGAAGLGLRAVALPGAVRVEGLGAGGLRRVAAAGVDRHPRRLDHGRADAVLPLHASRHRHAGGGAGRRRRPPDGHQRRAHDHLDLRGIAG